jgi:hypothetical protein
MYEKDSLAGPGTPEQEFDNFAARARRALRRRLPAPPRRGAVPRPAWGLPDMTEHMVSFARATSAPRSAAPGYLHGDVFLARERIDIAALVAEGCYLWLPSWQAEKPGAQYLDEWGEITIWQNGDDTMIGPVEMDHDIFYGTVEDFKALGRPATPIVDRYAELRQPYGPLGHTVHPYFHADYALDKYGYPLGPAALYSDGLTRQTFERGVFGSPGAARRAWRPPARRSGTRSATRRASSPTTPTVELVPCRDQPVEGPAFRHEQQFLIGPHVGLRRHALDEGDHGPGLGQLGAQGHERPHEIADRLVGVVGLAHRRRVLKTRRGRRGSGPGPAPGHARAVDQAVKVGVGRRVSRARHRHSSPQSVSVPTPGSGRMSRWPGSRR